MELLMAGWMYGALAALVVLGALAAWIIVKAGSARVSRIGTGNKAKPRVRTVVYRRHPVKGAR
jgi:hypothetical protein